MQFQQQPYTGLLLNKCTEKFYEIHRKAFVAESLFSPPTLVKSSGAGIFVWILQHFSKYFSHEILVFHFFYIKIRLLIRWTVSLLLHCAFSTFEYLRLYNRNKYALPSSSMNFNKIIAHWVSISVFLLLDRCMKSSSLQDQEIT